MPRQHVELSAPIFTHRNYDVHVGYVDNGNDVPHYLVVNRDYTVIEGSYQRLVEARAMCVVLGEQTQIQQESIDNGELVSELADSEKEKADAASKWN